MGTEFIKKKKIVNLNKSYMYVISEKTKQLLLQKCSNLNVFITIQYIIIISFWDVNHPLQNLKSTTSEGPVHGASYRKRKSRP